MGYDPSEPRDSRGRWGRGGFKPRLVPNPKGYVDPDEKAKRTKDHIAAQHGAHAKALATGKSHVTAIDLTKPVVIDPNAKYPDGRPKYLPANFGTDKRSKSLKQIIQSQHDAFQHALSTGKSHSSTIKLKDK